MLNELTITIPGAPISKKKCSKCQQVLVSSEFSKNKTKKDGLHTECKICASENCKTYRTKNSEKRKASQREKYRINKDVMVVKSRENYYRNKHKVLNRLRKTRERNNDLLYKSVGGSFCRICGYDQYIGSLQLHHIDNNQKENHKDILSNWLKIPNSEKFIQKLQSVDFTILCANCHVALHMGEIDNNLLTPLEVKT